MSSHPCTCSTPTNSLHSQSSTVPPASAPQAPEQHLLLITLQMWPSTWPEHIAEFQNCWPNSAPAHRCRSAAMMIRRNDLACISHNGCGHSSKDDRLPGCTVTQGCHRCQEDDGGKRSDHLRRSCDFYRVLGTRGRLKLDLRGYQIDPMFEF